MNGNTIAKIAPALVVLGALAGCSTSAHRTESYDSSTAGYGAPAPGAASGSGIVYLI